MWLVSAARYLPLWENPQPEWLKGDLSNINTFFFFFFFEGQAEQAEQARAKKKKKKGYVLFMCLFLAQLRIAR